MPQDSPQRFSTPGERKSSVIRPVTHQHPALQFTHPLPYGAILHDGGVQFVVFSRSATAMRLLLYDRVEDREPTEIIRFDRETDRWGDIWSIYVPNIGPGQLYHFQADGPFDPEQGQRFNGKARLIDPYAKALAGHFLPSDDGICRPPKCVVIDDFFDWETDRHLKRPLADTVIYEMHVRGFTRDATSGAQHPGTYLGVIEKIPYLKSLGVTAVELMPIYEFPMESPWGQKLERPNYWGYDPLAFFAPHQGYAAGTEPGCQVTEFKQMVKALHAAGIEVILDVVFNHTAEGNELGPTLGFKGLENKVYYMLGNGGSFYRNFTGCGNTINGNHPIVREMLFLCLRHWVQTYHIDGFRFDLASILSRNRAGEIIPNPPVVEMIAEDPLLSDTKVIAEAWDAAGAYQVGSFANLRWAEWNGRYRDDVRQYWRGDPHMVGEIATRLAGSADLYQAGGRQPYHSINFVTSHDGFPLNDLVSYAFKHNEDNNEGNRDGDDNNHSANYGVEGPTRKKNIEIIRQRQIKNFLATLLLSQGVPMLLAGDECRRTQRGNNNAYCQDNQISWFDWTLIEKHPDLVRFVQALVAFRRGNPTLRRRTFLSGISVRYGELPDVSWFNPEGGGIDWANGEQGLVCVFGAPLKADKSDRPRLENYPEQSRHVMLMLNPVGQPRQFVIPELVRTIHWRQFIDSAAESPRDIFPTLDGPEPPLTGPIKLAERSLLCYVASG
jgi:glycogen operon protein